MQPTNIPAPRPCPQCGAHPVVWGGPGVRTEWDCECVLAEELDRGEVPTPEVAREGGARS